MLGIENGNFTARILVNGYLLLLGDCAEGRDSCLENSVWALVLVWWSSVSIESAYRFWR